MSSLEIYKENDTKGGKANTATPQNDDQCEYYNDPPPPPDGGYGWVIVAVSFMCNMVVDGICYTFGIFLSKIADDYQETKGKTAWAGSLLTGMCMCVGPIVSALANKYGCRAACILGSLIATVAFVLSIYSPSVNWLMLVYGFIGGTGFGFIYLPAVVCVGYYFESKRSLATGIAVCGSGVGTFMFAPLATFLLERYGWRGANLILAGIIFNCVIFGALMRPLTYPNGKGSVESSKPLNVSEQNLRTAGRPTKAASHTTLTVPMFEARKRADSTGSFLKGNIVKAESATFSSKLSLSSRKGNILQPLARKDVFYSGSISNLKEFQSQKSLASYRHSILNISYARKELRQESGYISLSSIILVDLMGLDKLTDAFGLLILFRGAAALVGSPLAGVLYDITETYDSNAKPCRETATQLNSQNEDADTETLNIPPPPDGGYGWVIVVASFVCNMVVDGIAYTFGIFLITIVDYYDESKGKTAWVGSLLTGTYLSIGPLVSALCNKFGCREVCVAGSIISTVAFVASIFSPNVNWLMLTYGFFGGFGFGLIYLPAVVCVGYYFETKRSLATGIAVCGSGVGTCVFAPLARILLDEYGWKGANLILAGIILNCAIFGTLMRPLEYPKNNTKNIKMGVQNSSEGSRVISQHAKHRRSSSGPFLSRKRNESDSASLAFTSKSSITSRREIGHFVQPLARKDVFYSASVQNLQHFQSQKSLASYRQSVLSIHRLKPHELDCAKADGIEEGSASFLLSLIGIINVIGRIACGYLADFPQINALLINNICLVIATVSVGMTPFCYTYISYASIAVFFAIAVSGFISLSSIILVDLVGLDKLTDAFGLMILFRGAAALVGSPIAGALYDATQSYDITFYVAGGLFGLSAITSFLAPCIKKNDKKEETDNDALKPINEDIE
ncbi:hypothetical protein NQ317_011492 [Molorchus minor]|uniref:Major facilitator superfamily (MFS) profile domain-containing protein n=1 Tax=Molorchus minor TaxID=1323400 RepID=A0ABQ9IZF1_9CUCU|nr:hypothetical protein NQ317_011492 [Molorchus minor]